MGPGGAALRGAGLGPSYLGEAVWDGGGKHSPNPGDLWVEAWVWGPHWGTTAIGLVFRASSRWGTDLSLRAPLGNKDMNFGFWELLRDRQDGPARSNPRTGPNQGLGGA